MKVLIERIKLMIMILHHYKIKGEILYAKMHLKHFKSQMNDS